LPILTKITFTKKGYNLQFPEGTEKN